MKKEELISIAKKYLLKKYKINNKNYPLIGGNLVCTNFEEYQWKNARFRFDISPLSDILYFPIDSEFIMAYRFMVDESGKNVLDNPIYKEGHPTGKKESELPFYPGTGFFQCELEKINSFLAARKGKEIPVSGERIEREIMLTWETGSIELLRQCNTRITERERSYFLKHKLEMDFLLKEGRIPDAVCPHSWCEYTMDKTNGEISNLRIYDQTPPGLM